MKELNKMRIRELKAELEKETDKRKYCSEFFDGMTPESQSAQYYFPVFLVRRSLVVFIAL